MTRTNSKYAFRTATRNNLQLKPLLELVLQLASTSEQPEGVEWIMLDYRIQEWLFEFGERHGYATKRLEQTFQVPHGPGAQWGIVRHYPNHMNHMHVRFRCPSDDAHCFSPKLGPIR